MQKIIEISQWKKAYREKILSESGSEKFPTENIVLLRGQSTCAM